MKEKFFRKELDANLYLGLLLISSVSEDIVYFTKQDVLSRREQFMDIVKVKTFDPINKRIDAMVEDGLLGACDRTFYFKFPLPWSIPKETLALLAVGPRRAAQLYFYLKDRYEGKPKYITRKLFAGRHFTALLGYHDKCRNAKQDFDEALSFLIEVGLLDAEKRELMNKFNQLHSVSATTDVDWEDVPRTSASIKQSERDLRYVKQK